MIGNDFEKKLEALKRLSGSKEIAREAALELGRLQASWRFTDQVLQRGNWSPAERVEQHGAKHQLRGIMDRIRSHCVEKNIIIDENQITAAEIDFWNRNRIHQHHQNE
jgi:hypothetical protein